MASIVSAAFCYRRLPYDGWFINKGAKATRAQITRVCRETHFGKTDGGEMGASEGAGVKNTRCIVNDSNAERCHLCSDGGETGFEDTP